MRIVLTEGMVRWWWGEPVTLLKCLGPVRGKPDQEWWEVKRENGRTQKLNSATLLCKERSAAAGRLLEAIACDYKGET
jgi:hypothetical protein